MSPFFAHQGYHPLDLITPPVSPTAQVPSVLDRLEELANLRAELVANLQQAQERYSEFYNRKVLPAPEFKVGQLVFLRRKNIETTWLMSKLDHKYLGPFRIKATTKSDLAYVLNLPDTLRRIHPVFHVSLLHPAKPAIPGQRQEPTAPVLIADEPEYVVEQVLDSIQDHDGYFYLVHWEGYPDSEDTWEPYDFLKDVEAFKEFYAANKESPEHKFPPGLRRRRPHRPRT